MQEAAKAREKEERDKARTEGRRVKGPQDDLDLLSELQEELTRLQESLPGLEQDVAREGSVKKGPKAWGEERSTPGPEVGAFRIRDVHEERLYICHVLGCCCYRCGMCLEWHLAYRYIKVLLLQEGLWAAGGAIVVVE